jgi:hypothetical protein
LRHERQQGTIITLVAVFMLFVVGAMAALSIDAVTLYTARSEAQLAADSAALAAARVLANSGATSDGALMTAAQSAASAVAIQVAEQNQVGGVNLTAAQVSAPVFAGPPTNPTVTVRVQANLPTFFARIWGSTQVMVAASATSEAYNPTGGAGTSNTTSPPVAPLCVKPWLLPNLDPSTGTGSAIFDSSGNIINSSLLGWTSSNGSVSSPATPVPMTYGCANAPPGTCTMPTTLSAWGYLPGDDSSFPHPTNSLPTCSPALSSNYQDSIAGCVQLPISCRSPVGSPSNVDVTDSIDWNAQTADAVNCLTHSTIGGGDTVVSTNPPSVPFEFVIGSENPLAVVNASLTGTNTMVSDSLVTVPVFDTTTYLSGTPSVSIVGFVQLFLNPTGVAALDSGATSGQISTTVINMVGCAGTSPGAPPILGNGASPVAVRLISRP